MRLKRHKTVQAVAGTIRRTNLIPDGSRVLVATSGGADSTALAAILHELAGPRRRFDLTLAHYNHGLRRSAGRDERFVVALAERLELPVIVERGDVRGSAKGRRQSIEEAARELRCPVLANGNVFSATQATQLLAETGVRGLMIGRGAIRNPWLFDQIRAHQRGEPVKFPTGRDVLAYIRELWDNEITPGIKESSQVQRMKKFMNFIGEGLPAPFLHDIRRVETTAGFFAICERALDHDQPLPLEPLG